MKENKQLLFKIGVAIAIIVTFDVNAQNNLRDIPVPDPEQEMEKMQLAEGFEVNLFAADPMVVKPIQMNWDAEGRLWVVSSTIYPHMKTGEEANDKIYVLEDTDGDGVADKSTIFAEGLLTPTGILPGDGGVYVANSTEILHLMDTDGDGKADKTRTILTGFGTGDTHHLIHTFRWGPESLFYFSQSIYIYSHVETPWGIKRLEGGGVWQFRPETLELDVYARGLVNPWGMQFNKWGQSFLTDGAGGEGINYAFPGATFLAAPGAERILRGLNPGQPKHSGLEVISGRHLPEEWGEGFITNDFRANRINRFTVEEQGSGYATKQAEDLLWTDHVSFRPVDILMGPDGAIYVADWYNPIIQHGEVDFHDPRRDQEHGRIWRIVAKDRALVDRPNLTQASIPELLEALKLPEDWTRLHAKRVLKEKGPDAVIPVLESWVNKLDRTDPASDHHLLEALWVYQSFDVVNKPLLMEVLGSENHNARAAATRVLQFWQDRIVDVLPILKKGVKDQHPRVRLETVIALRQLASAEAASTSLAVLDQAMDEFLDFALWQTVRELSPLWTNELESNPNYFGDAKKTVYALKSVDNPVAVNHLVRLYRDGKVPPEYRREVLGSIAKGGTIAHLNTLFDLAIERGGNNAEELSAILGELGEAARQRGVKPDKELNRITNLLESGDESVTVNALRLVGYWDMDQFNNRLIALIHENDSKNIRSAAMGALASMDNPKSHVLLEELTDSKHSPDLRTLATAWLASLNAVEAAKIAVELLQDSPEQSDINDLFSSFLSRKEGTVALANAITETKIPENVAKAGRQAMQQSLPWYRQNDDEAKLLRSALEASGGVLPPERMPQKLNEEEMRTIVQQIKTTANPELGEVIYRRAPLACQTCHALGGAGGLIGPDLSSLGTSSPIENIIESLLSPNASIKEGYELQRVVKNDGGSVMGYLVRDGASELVLRNVAGQEVVIPKSQVDVHENIPGSLMPPGLTSSLERHEFIDLVGYLSKLGESGKFRVPNERYIRRWRTVGSNQAFESQIKEEGPGYVVNENAKKRLLPAYSMTSGALPLNELPVLEGGSGQSYSFVIFELEVLTGGSISLLFESATGILAWAGKDSLEISDNETSVELPEGIHQFTLAIDRDEFNEDSIRILLNDAASPSAQTRLVMGN